MNDSTISQASPPPDSSAGQYATVNEPQSNSGCYRFESFEIDGARRELRRHGLKIHLKGRPFTLLKVLVESQGRIVTRDELRGYLWSSDTHVDFDANLTTAFYKVRKALGDSSRESKFIETIPGQGYRFIEPVVPIAREPEKPPQPAAASSIETTLPGPSRKISLSRWRLFSVVAAAIVVLGIACVGYIRAQSTSVAHGTGVRLLVLPFANPSEYAADERFSDGLSEELITQLTRQHGSQISVIAETTSRSYKNANKSVQDMARELKVEYVVEGAVQRDDGHMHISARLVRASDQSEVWADSYDRPYADALNLESEVANRIGDALSAKIVSSTNGNRRFSVLKWVLPAN